MVPAPNFFRKLRRAACGWNAAAAGRYHRRPAAARAGAASAQAAFRPPPRPPHGPPAARMTPRPPLAALAVLAAGLAGPSASAQTAAPPSVAAESPGGAAILEDFNAVLDLAGKAGADQKRGLNDLLNGFLPGVDRKLPARVEALTGVTPTRYRVIIPVDNERNFEQNNLVPSGIRVRGIAGTPNVRRLGGVRGAAFDGYMSYLKDPKGGKYAVIVEERADLPAALVSVGRLLEPGVDAAFFLNNSAGDAAAVAARWEKVDDARAELEGALKRNAEKNETAAEYRLRKAAAAAQVTELGRFYAEAKQVLIRATTKPAAAGGEMTLLYRPLEGTESAAALDAIDAPSAFESVPFLEDAAFAGRTRFPLTARQVINTKSLVTEMRAVTLELAQQAEDPAEAEARAAGWNALFDAVDAVLDGGVVDAFARAESVDGKQRLLFAFALPPGTDVAPAVESFGKSRAGRSAKLNVAEVGGVALHEVTLGGPLDAKARELLGDNLVTVGTADGAAWVAAGPGGRAALEEAIGQAAETPGEADARFFRLAADPSASLDLLDLLEDVELPELFGEYRAVAEEALKGCDGSVRLTLQKQAADTVVGKGVVPSCVLAVVGRMMAKFSADEGLAG